MSALDSALLILTVHGALGGFDTLYCHEWQARLPSQPWARRELRLHSARSLLYAPIFLGLAWLEWHGLFAWLLFAAFAAEYAVTLADSLVEDQTRRLSRAERLVHMILGATTGGYFALVIYHASVDWIPAPSALIWTEHGIVSIILTVYAAGVLISGVRDAFAARHREATPRQEEALRKV